MEIKTEYQELVCGNCGEVFRYLGQSTAWGITSEMSRKSLNEAWEDARNHICPDEFVVSLPHPAS